MDVSTFLKEPGKSGYMVVVVGEGAPRFVHAADTSTAARTAAVAEAERLLRLTNRGGRALVLRLEAVVDQPPAEHSAADVRWCMPLTVAVPIDVLAKIADGLTPHEEARPTVTAAAGDLRGRPTACAAPDAFGWRGGKACLGVFVCWNGVYQRRDGMVVGIRKISLETATDSSGGRVFTASGRANGVSGPNHHHDLVREIVVGDGWKPWNGGVVFAEANERVDIVTRQCAAGLGSIIRNCAAFALRWSHEGKPDDILAYREVTAEAVGAPPFKVGDAVRVTEADGYVYDEIVAGCEWVASGWRVTFVGGASIDASCVSLLAREA